jgi:integrase/recombinase XerD
VDALIKDELLALLRVAKEHRERDWLLLLVTYHHGLRISETLSITKTSLGSGYLTIQRLKGSEKTTQKLVDHQDPLLSESRALFEFARNMRPNQRLFKVSRRQVDRLIKRYGELAQIPEHKRHAHALKHTTAMHMLETEKVNVVQKRLGHKNGASTLKYLAVGDEDADAGWNRSLA